MPPGAARHPSRAGAACPTDGNRLGFVPERTLFWLQSSRSSVRLVKKDASMDPIIQIHSNLGFLGPLASSFA